MKKIYANHVVWNTENKKVSINLDSQTLKMVDELAKILKADRTIMITNLIGHGIHPMVSYLKNTWSLIKKENVDKEKDSNIERLLSELSDFSKKWKTNKYLENE